MSTRRNQIHAGTAALAASLLLAPTLICAQGNAGQAGGEKAAPQGKTIAPRQAPPGPSADGRPKLSSSVSRRTQTTRGTPKGKRRLSARQRRARLHLELERVQEIQRALIQTGYLHEEATGGWDEPTRDAMRRYQADHGFPVTGLPEAKSLMKLGLGPHPLPPELDPSVTAQANASEATKVGPSTTSPPPPHPPDSASPPQK